MANKTLFDFLYLKERLPFEIGGGDGSASEPALSTKQRHH